MLKIVSNYHYCSFTIFIFIIIGALCENVGTDSDQIRKSSTDKSIHGYLTERTCLWNEICKEEFQRLFRCRCPGWSYCRAPGRYYNAFCTITNTGYIWSQPGLKQQPIGGQFQLKPDRLY